MHGGTNGDVTTLYEIYGSITESDVTTESDVRHKETKETEIQSS